MAVTAKLFVFLGASLIFSASAQQCGRNAVTDRTRSGSPSRFGGGTGPRISRPEDGDEVVAGRGTWPWMASLGRFDPFTGKWQHICGGSLVTDQHVLTAAHCLVPEVQAVRLGDGSLDESFAIQRRRIHDRMSHPNYTEGLPYFDVAVILMEKPATTGGVYIRPICLPTEPTTNVDEFKGDQVDVAGWGLKRINDGRSERDLRQVQQKVFTQKFCNQSHEGEDLGENNLDSIKKYLPNLFQDNIMCAGYEFGGRGSCKGDSGGPLIIYDQSAGPTKAKYTQIGVIQGGIGTCGSEDFPSVYVRVAQKDVLEFIQKALNGTVNAPVEDNIHTAVQGGDIKNVTRRTDLQDQINVKNGEGHTPLYIAVDNNDLRMVKLLVEEGGAYVDIKNGDDGKTALFLASDRAYTKIVRYLLNEADADPNIQTDDGFAPFYHSAFHGNVEVVRLFLEQPDTQVNIRNGEGDWLAITSSSQNGHLDVVKLLVEDGRVDVNLQDRYGFSALFQAAKNGHAEIVKVLVEEGQADIEVKHGDFGASALWQASNNSHVEVVQYLLDVGASANTKNSKGFAPLFWASFYGYEDIVELLVRIGKARVDERNGDAEWTSLQAAAEGGHPKIVKFLLTEGKATADLRDKGGFTALYSATKLNRLESLKVILKHGNVNVDQVNGPKAWSVLIEASVKGHTEIVKYLLTETNANVNLKSNDGFAALHRAAFKGHFDIVKLLVEVGKANVDIKNGPGDWTALDAASDQGHEDIVRYLIQDGGATVDVKDRTKRSPFFYAALNGHLGVVRELVESGEVDVDDRNGDEASTALHAAAQRGHYDVVRYLVEDGKASVTQRNGAGETAKQLAEKEGHAQIVAYLQGIERAG